MCKPTDAHWPLPSSSQSLQTLKSGPVTHKDTISSSFKLCVPKAISILSVVPEFQNATARAAAGEEMRVDVEAQWVPFCWSSMAFWIETNKHTTSRNGNAGFTWEKSSFTLPLAGWLSWVRHSDAFNLPLGISDHLDHWDAITWFNKQTPWVLVVFFCSLDWMGSSVLCDVILHSET